MSQPLALIHESRVVSLAGRAVQIGRLPESEIVLDGPEVSRRHARIVPTPEGPLIVDRSRYGTLVNGSQVVAPLLLHEGDVVQIGPWVLEVSRAAPAAEPRSETGWRGRLLQWRRRYGASELVGTVAAVLAAVATRRATGSVLVAAYAATFAEAAWFYGVLAVRDTRRAARAVARTGAISDGHFARGALRNIALEFGAAEALDALALRPLAIGLGLHLLGDVPGAVAGKLVADVLFYGPVLRLFHWQLAPRPAAESHQELEQRHRPTSATLPTLRRPGGDPQ